LGPGDEGTWVCYVAVLGAGVEDTGVCYVAVLGSREVRIRGSVMRQLRGRMRRRATPVYARPLALEGGLAPRGELSFDLDLFLLVLVCFDFRRPFWGAKRPRSPSETKQNPPPKIKTSRSQKPELL